MNKFKILIITGTVIAVAAIIAIVYVVAFHNPASTNDPDKQQVQGITYTNNEFGYKLTLPKSWDDYEVSQIEETTMFFLPAEGVYKDEGYKYGAIFYITAIPMTEVANQEVTCRTPDPNRHWSECAAVNNSIGGNNAYRFYTAFADDYMTGFEDEGKLAQESIEFFDVENAPEYRTYRNIQKDYIYEFEYPTNTFTPQYGEEVILPYDYERMKYSSLTLNREIAVEYCGASGECRPTTTNMKIGSIVLDDTLATIRQTDMGSLTVSRIFGTNNALVLSQGVEGEGIEYYFIETPDGKVLMMYFRYINEEMVLNYKSVPDFIPYDEQVEIAENIIQSIKFTN